MSGYVLRGLTKCGLPEPKVSAVFLSIAFLKLFPVFTAEVTTHLLLLLATSQGLCLQLSVSLLVPLKLPALLHSSSH